MKLNCWEFMRCGREPGGGMVDEMGECVAATSAGCDGVNSGTNAGRICWIVAGTLCGGDVQSTYAHKATTCFRCLFYQQVRREEGADFEQGSTVLPKIYDPLQMAQAYEQLSALALSMSFSEELERHLIATELHDRIGQNLAVAKLRVDALCGAALPEQTAELERISALIKDVIHETRSLTFEISSPLLYDLGLVPAIEWMLEHVEQKHRLPFALDADDMGLLNFDVQVLLFQALRELVNNVVKHAGASEATLRLRRRRQTVEASVWDNGAGFDPRSVGSVGSVDPELCGFGLISIRGRLALLGGRLEVAQLEPRGTRVTIVAPTELDPRLTRNRDRHTTARNR